MERLPDFVLRVSSVRKATPSSHVVRLDLGRASLPYQAGQVASLGPVDSSRQIPYSIASAPEETVTDASIQFLIKSDSAGRWGLHFDPLRRGSLLAVRGPAGSFVFPEAPRERRFLFIAGGTGIAPLRSMLWHTLLAERPGRIGLVYSVRSPEELAYREEFEKLDRQRRVTFRHTVTRSASDGWTGRQGRIDAAALKDMVDPGNTLCFVCGPPALVGDIRPRLNALGVNDEQIRIEQWG
jgi:NAD(P)H-flavin reductase